MPIGWIKLFYIDCASSIYNINKTLKLYVLKLLLKIRNLDIIFF